MCSSQDKVGMLGVMVVRKRIVVLAVKRRVEVLAMRGRGTFGLASEECLTAYDPKVKSKEGAQSDSL